MLTVKTPLGALHANLQERTGLYREGIAEPILSAELRLALFIFTKTSPGFPDLPVAAPLEDDLRAGDDLDLPGRI